MLTLKHNNRSLGTLIMMVWVALSTASCASSATLRVRTPGQAPNARVGVRVDSSAVGSIFGFFEQMAAAEGRGARSSSVATSERVERPSSAALRRAGETPERSGGSVSGSLSAGEAGSGSGSEVVAGVGGSGGVGHVEVGSSGSAGLSGSGSASSGGVVPSDFGAGSASSGGVAPGEPGAGVASGSGGGSGRAAGSGAVAEGSRLVDIVSEGVLVGGRPVRLSDIAPLSGFDGSMAVGGASPVRLPLFGRGPVHAQVALSPVRGEPGQVDVVVGLRGSADEAPARQRRRVHLVLDCSESMEPIWDEVVAAARGLIEHLSPRDYLQIVAYGSSATNVLPPTVVGDGSAAIRALGEIRVGGYTNIEAGLDLAYDAVEGASSEASGDSVVVILVSDGVPNVGAFGSVEVGAIAARARRELDCTTATVGLGLGFDAEVLRAVSREGRGGYHVARDAQELLPRLVAEVTEQAWIAGREVAVTFDLEPEVDLVSTSSEATVDRRRRTVHFGLPAIRVEQERSVSVRLNIGGRASASLGGVSVSFSDGAGGFATAEQYLTSDLTPAGVELGPPTAVIDAELAAALDEAARAVRNDDGAAAARLLTAHCIEVRGQYSADLPSPLRRRLARVERLAGALGQLVTGAPEEDRGAVARAMGSVSVRLTR